MIPREEFGSRAERARELVREAGLDALLVHSNEAEMANVRYFSDYWPIFESAGVLIPAHGDPALLIGAESETFARDRSVIPDIYKMFEYREPADPEYPDIEVASFPDVFRKHCGGTPKKVGLGGWIVLPMPVWKGLQSGLPDTEFVRADRIMQDLRGVKSPAEIECLAEAFRISELALDAVIAAAAPGVTELALVGTAQQAIYAEGAEYEGMPQYVLSGANTTHAISRPTSREIRPGDAIQLNISARVDGYSSGVGRPAFMGTMTDAVRELVEFGLEAHEWTVERMLPGVPAARVAEEYDAWVRSRGYGEYLLYGPCHGLGIIEVEPPWLEKTSTYELAPGMTFQVDTFFHTPPGSRLAGDAPFGLRWEDGLVITDDGNRLLSRRRWECIEI